MLCVDEGEEASDGDGRVVLELEEVVCVGGPEGRPAPELGSDTGGGV